LSRLCISHSPTQARGQAPRLALPGPLRGTGMQTKTLFVSWCFSNTHWSTHASMPSLARQRRSPPRGPMVDWSAGHLPTRSTEAGTVSRSSRAPFFVEPTRFPNGLRRDRRETACTTRESTIVCELCWPPPRTKSRRIPSPPSAGSTNHWSGKSRDYTMRGMLAMTRPVVSQSQHTGGLTIRASIGSTIRSPSGPRRQSKIVRRWQSASRRHRRWRATRR